MDAKDLRTESGLGERNDGSKFSQSGVALQCNRNKSYQDIGTNPMGKVEATVRPCAVIGPDRVVPPAPPSADPFLKKASVELWPENLYPRPPEYHHKHLNNVNPMRNISPRQTFQENMQRIMVPPTYSAVKHTDDLPSHNVHERNSALSKTKQTMASEAKYSDVPYTVNLLANEHKNIRPTEMCVPSVNSPLSRTAHGWAPAGVNVPAPRAYGAHDIYQYPQYPNCAGTRPPVMPLARPHRTFQEDCYSYPDAIYQDASVRFKPYPTVKERYPQPRYDYVPNYSSPFQPPPTYGPHKYDIPNARPHPYPVYPHMKYLENRIPDPNIEAYQRSTQQSINYNMQFRNQIIHPTYAPGLGNPLNKALPYPDSMKSSNKLPVDTNKTYVDYENSKMKYPSSDSYFINEMARVHQAKAQTMPNYTTPGLHPVPMQQYHHRKDLPLKSYEYMPHYRHYEHPLGFNHSIHHQSQFSPNTLAISPTDSNTSNDTTQTQGTSQEDCGYVSQSSTASVRSVESSIRRLPNDYYRRFDYRYRPIIGSSHVQPRAEPNSSKEDDKIDVRQFLSMWNEGDEDCGNNNSKEVVGSAIAGDQKPYTKRHETQKTQEELYVLGLVNVPSEELSKYEHIQRISKLPENIKGYDCIEILNQFEEVIESSNINSYKSSPSRDYIKCKNALKQMVEALPRPVSPLDVEAKISQSVIHKEVGCNFEIKPCSPKMMNAEVATPVQNVLSERIIEKVSNPHSNNAKSPTTMQVEGNKMRRQESTHTAYDSPSCKMVGSPFTANNMESIKTNYCLQDLETSSGVCLASLPRLDNEIELNFPEVNQQFINANKVDNCLVTEHSHESTEDKLKFTPSNENNILTQTDPEENANIVQDESGTVLTKLSKYRKAKVNNLESVEEEPNTNAIRTDSVIIENPENVRRNEEKTSSNRLLEEGEHTPINLTSQIENPENVRRNEEKTSSNRLLEEGEHTPINLTSQNNEMQNVCALDFSTNKSRNGLPIINEDEIVKSPQNTNVACDNVEETDTDKTHTKKYTFTVDNQRDSDCQNITSIILRKKQCHDSHCEITHDATGSKLTPAFNDNVESIDKTSVSNRHIIKDRLSSDNMSIDLNFEHVTHSVDNTNTKTIKENKYIHEVKMQEDSELINNPDNKECRPRLLLKFKKSTKISISKSKSKQRRKTKAILQNNDSLKIYEQHDKSISDIGSVKIVESNSVLDNQIEPEDYGLKMVPKIYSHDDTQTDASQLVVAKHIEDCPGDKLKKNDSELDIQTGSNEIDSVMHDTNHLSSDHDNKYYRDLISGSELFINNTSLGSINQERNSLFEEKMASSTTYVLEHSTNGTEFDCDKIQSGIKSNLDESTAKYQSASPNLRDSSSSHEEGFQNTLLSKRVTFLNNTLTHLVDDQPKNKSNDKNPKESVEATSTSTCTAERISHKSDTNHCVNNTGQFYTEGTDYEASSATNESILQKPTELDSGFTAEKKHGIESGYKSHENALIYSSTLENTIDTLVDSNAEIVSKCTQETPTNESNLNNNDKGSDRNVTITEVAGHVLPVSLYKSLQFRNGSKEAYDDNKNMEIASETSQIPKLQCLCKKILDIISYSNNKIMTASETAGDANDTPEILNPHINIDGNYGNDLQNVNNHCYKSEKNEVFDLETDRKIILNNKLSENSHYSVSESVATKEHISKTFPSSCMEKKEHTKVLVTTHCKAYPAYSGKKQNSPCIQNLMMFIEGKIYDTQFEEIVTELQDNEKIEETNFVRPFDSVLEEVTSSRCNDNESEGTADLNQDKVSFEVMNSEFNADSFTGSSKDEFNGLNAIKENYSECDADLIPDEVGCEVINSELHTDSLANCLKDEHSSHNYDIPCDKNNVDDNYSECDADLIKDEVMNSELNADCLTNHSKDKLSSYNHDILCDKNNINDNYSESDADFIQGDVMNSELNAAHLENPSKNELSSHNHSISCNNNDINENYSECDADFIHDGVVCAVVNSELNTVNPAESSKDKLSCLNDGILCSDYNINQRNEENKTLINESPFDFENKSEFEEVSIEQCDVPNDIIDDTNEISFSYPNSSIISQITENIFQPPDNVLELKCAENNEKQDANCKDFNLSINHCRSLKRSFSDSALNKHVNKSEDIGSMQYVWPPKRNKIGEFDNFVTNNRRNSVNIEGNVSFCILIDNNCIITEENEEKICITELQEDFITAVGTKDDEVNSNSDSLKEQISSLHDSNVDYAESVIIDCEENNTIQSSWINDIGCVETVFSDEVAENVIISAPSSPTDSTSENECDVSAALSADTAYNQSDHVFMGGERMSDNPVSINETLFSTSVLDMDKALMSRENMDESIRHLSDLDQDKILIESDNWKPSPTHTPDYIDSAHTSNDFRLDTPENKENVFVKELSPLRRIDDYLDDSSAENEIDENKMPQVESGKTTQDGTVHSCESSLDNVFRYEVNDESVSSSKTSNSPEVSSTTSEEMSSSSSILLKITNLNGSRVSQINESKRPRCKFTEKIEYSTSDLNFPNGPLITKAAQKYIPPIKESIRDLKVQISLPQQKLMKLKQLKMSRNEPKVHKPNNVMPRVTKKPKPNFDDVLKSIDEIQIKMHKEKNKKNKTVVPKVVIKKSQNGSHYASIPKKDTYNPDLTGRKWQPWVFLEKDHFIDKMAIKKKTRAIFSHRKNTFVLAEKFRKYKSASSTKFVISQPKTSNSSGQLKYTIRLKHSN